jgi:hypothetical protein
VLKGFTQALLADAKPAEAARVVKAARRVAEKSAAQDGALKPIEVELLLAKVYSQWRGHNAEAFQVYDEVIRQYPEDFRCVVCSPQHVVNFSASAVCVFNQANVLRAAHDGAAQANRGGAPAG